MERFHDPKTVTLTKALELLRKVLSTGETKFNKEDWQMLQVARFLVSKEKFIKRDADNKTLHYASVPSFYYIDELNEVVYTIAKYIYDNDPGLIIDRTKVVEYGFPIGVEFANRTNPTFEEAIIIINMIRNSIVHGSAIIDFDNSVLSIDNTMPDEMNPDIIKFHINCDLPMSMLAKLDVGNIVKKNQGKIREIVFRAIAEKSYLVQDDKVFLILNHNGFEIRMGLKPEEFMDLYYYYDQNYEQEYKIEKQINDIDFTKYKNLRLNRNYIGSKFSSPPGAVDAARYQKDMKDLSALLELINNTPSNALDPRVIKKMLELTESPSIPKKDRIEALKIFRKILEGAHYQDDSEKAVDSISFALGISDEEKSLDFVALYNYMTLLFSHYPLKEGNAMLTEFIDLSTVSVDMNNTRDTDISSFHSDVEKIIRRHMKKYEEIKEQYDYPIPCLTELLRCLTEILRKFKTRNNAYIRHIRNALDHSGIWLDGSTVELRDYVHSGDTIDKTFRSKINLNKLLMLSAAYTYIYNIPTYRDYQNFVCDDQNAFLSFHFVDMFRELGKGIDLNLLAEFLKMLNSLSVGGLGREFSLDGSVVDLVEELPYAIAEKKKDKGPGSK